MMPMPARTCCAIALAISATFAWADDFDNSRQLIAKARQLAEANDEAARSAYLEVIVALDALNRGQDREVARTEGSAYLELGTLDEKLGRGKDAEADYIHAINASLPLGAGDGAKVISPALKRQQVLYMRDGDFQHAAEAATRELGLMGILFGRDTKMTSGMAYQELPPTLVLAKANAAAGELKTAKVFYDQAWTLAETATVSQPGALQELYTGSVAVYSQLQLAKEADEAQQRFERLKQEEARRRTMVVQAPPAKAPEAYSAPGPEVVPDVKAGFKDGARPGCDPVYTPQMRELQQQGTVALRFRIARNGSLVYVNILQSSGFKLLDRATQNGFSRCQFSPAMYHGQPVDGEFDLTYVWKTD